MVTDLRQALRDAVEPDATDGVDLASVVAAGRQRVQRRRVVAIASAAAATAAVAAMLVVPGRLGHDDAVRPAEPVRLDLDQAQRVRADVLASTRTRWLHPATDDIDFDQLLGTTDDGLVVRSRYTYDGDVSELGLLDPATGRTAWLPRPPWDLGEPQPLALGTDRLLFWDQRQTAFSSLLTWDRSTLAWSRVTVPRPSDAEGKGYGTVPLVPGVQTVVGADDRVYVVDPVLPGLRWWSAPVDGGGEPSPEPSLDGHSLAWAGATRLTADSEGRVVATRDGDDQVLAERSPEGCTPPDDGLVPWLAGSGEWAFVTFACEQSSVVVAYELTGRATVRVPGATALVADGDRALLQSHHRLYLLDASAPSLLELGAAPHEGLPDLAGDLVVTNRPGPLDDDDAYDVSWTAERLP